MSLFLDVLSQKQDHLFARVCRRGTALNDNVIFFNITNLRRCLLASSSRSCPFFRFFQIWPLAWWWGTTTPTDQFQRFLPLKEQLLCNSAGLLWRIDQCVWLKHLLSPIDRAVYQNRFWIWMEGSQLYSVYLMHCGVPRADFQACWW